DRLVVPRRVLHLYLRLPRGRDNGGTARPQQPDVTNGSGAHGVGRDADATARSTLSAPSQFGTASRDHAGDGIAVCIDGVVPRPARGRWARHRAGALSGALRGIIVDLAVSRAATRAPVTDDRWPPRADGVSRV